MKDSIKKDFDLVIICGAPASGKMTIGQSLKQLTDYKLLHNHMSLELVNQFFDFGTPNFKHLDKKIRFDIFREIANSDIKGLIFTIVWAFDYPEDEAYIDEIIAVFDNRNLKVSIVELNCDLEERLKRNKHENRLKHKPSKRNIEFSEKLLLNSNEKYRMYSFENEFPSKNIFKIDNTNLTALETAERIIQHYKLQ